MTQLAKPETQLISEFLNGITQASGSASQLIHLLQDPRFIPMRDVLDMVKAGTLDIAAKGIYEGNH